MSSEENLLEIPESQDWKTKAINAMTEWNAQYYMWKTFDEHQIHYIKSYVGLMLFNKPNDDDDLNPDINFETLYNKYDEEKRSKIDEIFNQFQFDHGQLRLSHTLLYLSERDLQVCVFRVMRVDGEVHFIDFIGRLYSSWGDFVETNQLPKCEYMAPKDGIHDMLAVDVEVHKSPASSKFGTICDFVACGATFAAVGLGFMAAAPGIAVVLGVSGTMYGVGQSVSTLVDRKKHKQSIAPTNLESAGCYANITTSTFVGASSLALSKSTRILEMSGKYRSLATTAIKGVNYTAVASTFTNFGVYAVGMKRKLRNGDLSWSDMIDFSINVFLIYGTISNARQMRSYFSSLEVNTTPPKGVSKWARRRWRKQQAKLSVAGGSSGNQNVTKVGAWDPEVFSMVIRTSKILCHHALNRHCPALLEIFNNVEIIIEDVHLYSLNLIKPDVFFSRIIIHGCNLYTLLKNNTAEVIDCVKNCLHRLGIIASPESISEISNIVDDGVITINNANEEISLEDDFDSESEQSVTDCIFHETILNLVKRRICRNKVDATENLLSIFAHELSLVTNEINSKVVQGYEDMLSYNIRLMGEEKAKLVLSQIGINSKDDFASRIIQQIIDSLKTDDRVNTSINLEKQLDELFSLYRDLFLIIADGNDISSIKILETCEILNNSIGMVIQPLSEFYKKGKEIYEMNVKFFGHDSAMIFVFAALDLDGVSLNCENYPEIIFTNLAKKKLNLSEIVPQLLPIKRSSIEAIDKSINFTDDFKMETLIRICDFYVQRMDSNEITKIYSFVTDKFTDHFQSLANQQNTTTDVTEKLKLNIGTLGKSNFNMMCRFLHETNQLEIFNQVAEIFKKENFVVELIAEYYKKMIDITDFHAEYFKHLMADDGVTIYTINVENRNDIENFKQQAANLFNLDKYRIDVVERAENLVILKSADKYLVFQFMKNETNTLIMQIDLSKKNEENE